MDWKKLKDRTSEKFGKYKYVLLVLFLGIALMKFPVVDKAQAGEVPMPVETEPNLQNNLEEILGRIEGVGKVQVLLTVATSEEKIYQSDEYISGDGSVRRDTVIITDDTREEMGLIRTITPPTYLGAIIVCQGADNARVHLAVVQAVAGVTGIGTDRIIVLKMK